MHRLIAPRDQKYQSNFVEFRSLKIVYRRYAGLFFCVCVDANDNELSYLEAIHFFVEVLDSFFGNVCELDLVFNFWKVGLPGAARPRGGGNCAGLLVTRMERAGTKDGCGTNVDMFANFGGIRSTRSSTKSSLLERSRRPVNRLC